jgi:hypothetical protein
MELCDLLPASASGKFCHDFDLSDDGSIECGEIFSGNPIFLVLSSACLFDLIASQEVGPNLKSRNVTAAPLGIPVSCDLRCIRFGEDGVEDGLFWQPRWERTHACGSDEFKLLDSNGTPQRYRGFIQSRSALVAGNATWNFIRESDRPHKVGQISKPQGFLLTGYILRRTINGMKRGRPRKAKAERLTVVMRHRLSKQEHRKLCAAAKQAGLSVSEYVRRKLIESYEVKK